ncbi:MAG TPA: hypothetical protein VF753_09080 [Terriglobales bacterium]
MKHDNRETMPGTVYVYEKPAGGWISMMQTAKLDPRPTRGGALGNAVAIAPGIIVAGVPVATTNGAVWIFDEPAGGWVDSSEASYVLTEPDTSALGGSVSLTQNGQVLTASCGITRYKPRSVDLAYVWHADQQWSKTIRLSSEGEAMTAGTSASTANWAFTGDGEGNVFVFDGK